MGVGVAGLQHRSWVWVMEWSWRLQGSPQPQSPELVGVSVWEWGCNWYSFANSVIFKSIGTTYNVNEQVTLRKVGEVVPVIITPEPDNQFDWKAIAFMCNLGGKWHRIGYIVRETLDNVHTAFTHNRITTIAFSWFKYIVVWMRYGPGYYAGINITTIGEWSVEVSLSKYTNKNQWLWH